MSREDLLSVFSVTPKNKSAKEAIFLLAEFGFQLLPGGGREVIYQNDATHKTVRFNPRSDNIGRDKWSEIKGLCEEVLALSKKTAVKMVEYKEAVYLPDIPEFRGYVTLKSSQAKEAQAAKIAQARGIIEGNADKYREQLAFWELNYGLNVLRDTHNDTLTIEIQEAGIQKEFSYASAGPNEVLDFIKQQVAKADEVLLAREEKLAEFAAIDGASIVKHPDEQKIELRPPVACGRVRTIDTFGKENFLTRNGMRDLEDAIEKVHDAKRKKTVGKIAKPEAGEEFVFPDGVILSRRPVMLTSGLDRKALAAKTRLFEALKEIAGVQDMEGLYAPLRAVGFSHDGADKFVNPAHDYAPTLRRGDKTNVHRNIEQFIRDNMGKGTEVLDNLVDATVTRVKKDVTRMLNGFRHEIKEK